MSLNTFKTALQDLFQKQKKCDVTFSCRDATSSTGKSTIMAHKLVLSIASNVFKTIFNGEAAKHEMNLINIDNIQMSTFKLFLSFIYNNLVEFETLEIAAEFYYVAHKYNAIDALEFIKTYMLKEMTTENAIIFHEVACLYQDQDLKGACVKIFSEQTMDILNSPTFLTADPKIIEEIYKLNTLYITSEWQLINALERYITHNQGKDPDIAEKVRPALSHIRFLTLSEAVVAKTTLLNPENSLAVIRYLSSGDTVSEMPTFLSSNNKKRVFLRYANEIELILKLSHVYSDKYCTYCIVHNYGRNGARDHAYWDCWNVIKDDNYIKLRNIYQKYNHVQLLDYDLDDLKAIYEIYKSMGKVN